MSVPGVGDQAEATWTCSYKGSSPAQPAECDRDATTHVMVMAEPWGLVSLASCTFHAPIARVSGVLVAEHAYVPDCIVTDCWFKEGADG